MFFNVSRIHTKNQVLQENIPIQGMDMNLVFLSSKFDGYTSLLFVQLLGAEVPQSLVSLKVSMFVEGKEITTPHMDPEANLTYTFSWDKKNVFKQLVFGVVNVRGQLGHCILTEVIYYQCNNDISSYNVSLI